MSVLKWRILIGILFAISLPLPAFTDRTNITSASLAGWICLIVIPSVCLFPAWWANPCLLVGVLTLGKSKLLPRILGALAFGLALSFRFADPFLDRSKFAIYSGYWFWLSSMIAMLVSSFVVEIPLHSPKKFEPIEEP